ncbi:MAG: hypothetical protein ACJA0Y_000496 [Maricaulis maris]|jgi:uncharacterized protein YidB (DUF937 family)
MSIDTPFIDTAPEARWLSDRMEITTWSGTARLPSIWTRHAAEALAATLLRELAKRDGVTVQDMRARLANTF